MTISDHIQKKVLEPRLRERSVVVVYDADGRYRELALSMAGESVRVVDAGESIVEAREAATEAVVACGRQPEQSPKVLIYVPASPPIDEDNRCGDFFSAFAEAGARFPDGDGDRYLDLCLAAKPDFAASIRELFSDSEPSFAAVDAVGADGGRFPRLRTTLGCESNAEILAALLAPLEEQESHLKHGGGCRKEALGYLESVLGFLPRKANASWSIVRSDLWRFVLFSEFVYDLPGDLPDSLSTVKTAPREKALDLVFRVCDLLRDGIRTRPIYIEESERVAKELDLEKEMAHVRDLGVRDTFSFEERSFLAGYIDAVREGDYTRAEKLAEGRKGSVWVQESDRQILWTLAGRALELLRGVGDFDRELDRTKPDTAELIGFYTGRGYRLDQRYRYFEETLTEIDEDLEDLDRLVEECRNKYRDCVDRLQRVFIGAVRKSGWPVSGMTAHGTLFDGQVKPLVTGKDARVAVIWVDALRYELAVALNGFLTGSHKTELSSVCGALPSITPIGMASLLPGASSGLSLREKEGKPVPYIGERPIGTARDRVALLAAEYGDRFIDVPFDELVNTAKLTKIFREKFEHKSLALVRYHHIDRHGEGHAPDLFRMLKRHIDKLLKAVRRLTDLGYRDIFLHTDHGFLVFPESSHGNKATKPDGPWLLQKERVLAGDGGSNAETVQFSAEDLGVHGDIRSLVFPKTLATFTEGVCYFHGGLSIQECVIPALHIRAGKPAETREPAWELQLNYRGKTSGIVTTRRPVIGIAAFSEDMFRRDITFNLVALNESGELIGTAASGDHSDKNTGYVTLRTGQTAKIPMTLAEDFNGAFEIRAQDPETNKYLGNALKLETRILE